MKAQEKIRLRIYTTEAARHEGHCLFELILKKTRDDGMAGITVLRGIAGYGRAGHAHMVRLIELSGNLPIVIDIVDTKERIDAFAEVVVPWVTEGIVTVEAVTQLSAE